MNWCTPPEWTNNPFDFSSKSAINSAEDSKIVEQDGSTRTSKEKATKKPKSRRNAKIKTRTTTKKPTKKNSKKPSYYYADPLLHSVPTFEDSGGSDFTLDEGCGCDKCSCKN